MVPWQSVLKGLPGLPLAWRAAPVPVVALPAGPGWWAAPLGALGAKVARVRAATPPAPMLVVTPAPALLLVAVPEVPVWLVRAVTPVVGRRRFRCHGAPGGAVDGASSGVGGGGGGMAASAGAATPGMGAMAMPIAGMAAARAVMAAGGGQSGPVNAGPPVRETAPAAPEPEAAAPAPGEVEAPVPQMAVLPTADPGIAAAAAPGSKPQATRATGTTGIPASPLRSSPAGTESKRSAPTQDQQDGAEQTAAEDTVVPLRPEAVAGNCALACRNRPAFKCGVAEKPAPERAHPRKPVLRALRKL
ncbi:pPE family protein [Mycobacterium ulcerans str. Harvey]|uniref:PPE family protein n=1 Tax=Mycobacterium ulcerans str. Harvey TaxID=1299332 RepID=A0ABN0QW99_MYCUL|nr:pPE family protein [Mycobacterium ulcerans str. Harvey]